MRIWDIAIKQPVLMTMILLAGVVLGAVSYTRIPVNLFPDVEFPVIVITTAYPGAGPEEVEEAITEPLEAEFSTLAGIDDVSSQSREGLSQIVLIFSLDTELNTASQEAQEIANVQRRFLPDDAQDPIVRRFNPANAPILRFGVADPTGEYTPATLLKWVEDNIAAPLDRVDGVSQVEVTGGDVREVQVLLNVDAMEARRVAPQQVITALQAENLNIPMGSVTDRGSERTVRIDAQLEEPAELESIVVAQRGAPVYLGDVAEVRDTFAERDSISRLNGEESIVVSIRKESGGNTLRVADDVKAELDVIREANPDLTIALSGDESELVRESANGALSDLLWGALLAGLVILLFFRNVRNTLLTIAGMPIIIISTLLFLDIFNVSLNQISLLALALVIGLIIDDGIVVRENILRWIEKGYMPREAASRATAEVIVPVIATTATILAVFLPVAYAQGLIGQFFRDFGLTVSLAIMVSTFEALTLAPMLAAYFFKPSQRALAGDIDEAAGDERAGSGPIDRIYRGALHWTLDHRWLTGLIALVIVAGSLYSAQFIDQAFIPNIDRGQFDVSMELPPGAPLETTTREALKVETVLLSHPAVSNVFTSIGSDTASETAGFFVTVDEESDATSRSVIEDLRQPLAQVPGIAFELSEGATGGDQFIGGKDIVIEMSAAPSVSFDELGVLAQQMQREFEAIDGFLDVENSYNPGKPEVNFEIDRRQAAQAGLSVAQIGSTMRTLVNGESVSTFRGVGEEAQIVLRLREEDRAGVNDLLNLELLNASGQYIPLSTIANAEITSGPTSIQRVNSRPTITLGGNVFGRELPDVQSEVAALIESTALPAGVDMGLGGDAEDQAEAFSNLSAALLLAVVFIYMVLASQFGSFVQPLLIMIAMPLSIIGALLALNLTNRPLDLTSFIGFIMLMGLVTKNSILLVDFANTERGAGASADLAMRRAGPVRLRPILMTAISLILAMIPVALGLTEGGEFRQSMAIAIMGGMITSTFLTLFVVPVAYSMVVGFQERKETRVQFERAPDQGSTHIDRNLELVPDDSGALALQASERPDLTLQGGGSVTVVDDGRSSGDVHSASPQPAAD